jgi:hypothetical protein
MRTNYEDDLVKTGRLYKLARATGWHHHHALGALLDCYKRTQAAGIVVAAEDEIVACIVFDHDTEDDARRLVRGMLTAKLASPSGDGIHIHGNEKHVERLKTYHSNASKGGLATAAKHARGKKKPSDGPAVAQAIAGQAIAAPIGGVIAAPNATAIANEHEAKGQRRGALLCSLPPVDPHTQGESLREVTASQVPMADAKRIVDTYYAEREAKRGTKPPLIVRPAETQAAREVLVVAGWRPDCPVGVLEAAERAVRAFVGSEVRDYWVDNLWPLYALTDPRDFAVASSIADELAAGKAKPRNRDDDPPRRVVPSAQETAARADDERKRLEPYMTPEARAEAAQKIRELRLSMGKGGGNAADASE